MIVLVALWSFVALMTSISTVSAHAGPEPFIDRLVIDGTINPAVAEFVHERIAAAHHDGARALVIELDTLGGLLESTRRLVKDILGSPVPVLVYVTPSGASAGSAGVFITMAAHVAAMAPGTTIGAAAPVRLGGRELAGAEGKKLENFVAAYGATLARRRHRNVDWAIKAVRESVIITDSEALKLNVVDLVAPNLTALLDQASGREVEVAGLRVSLALRGVAVHVVEMRLSYKVINFLAHPNVAYPLLVAGVLGLLLEFATPGVSVAGVGGVICLLLALTALQALPINATGLALILLAVGLWIAEAFVPGFGILGIGGIVAFLLGSLILFDVPGERLPIDRGVLVTTGTLLCVGMVVLGYLLMTALSRAPVTGIEGLVGEMGQVTERIAPIGKVQVHGEVWTAESNEPLDVGEKVQIARVDNLRLHVRAL